MLVENSKDNLYSIVNSANAVIIDFWAPWCGPCKVMKPIFEKLAETHKDILFVSVNVEDNTPLAQECNILSIPTFLLAKNGQVVSQIQGSVSEDAFKDIIEKYLK